MTSLFKALVAGSVILSAASADAAIALDRTRAIFPGNQKNISLTITNENKAKPYLAQAWLENAHGEKINTPFTVIPPLQRVDAGKKSVIRLNDVAASSLPQDRESVFWFNVREVPPKSEKANVLQVALQTKIKVFYRPASIVPDKFTRWDDQLVLHRTSSGYRIENPTPYYITVVSVTGGQKEGVDKNFKAVMIEPKSSATVQSKTFTTPYVTTINDFGGKPQLPYRCNGDVCKAYIPEKVF
ncbi:molecular chaperone [Klebsiella pneumoniae]|uniref:fimbrial biogenesis chaperone n=1 Tax=Klebsiella pneumoniae TaxID=573 RepID=UPI0039B49342